MDLGLKGKRAIVLGVANKRSIAWAIAQALATEGVQLALTYQERMEESVRQLAEPLDNPMVLPCDVQRDDEVASVFRTIGDAWGALDIVVHSLAFAPREALDGDFLDTKREAFSMALDISAYSLVHVAREAAPLLEKAGGGSIITMTYLGSERAMPGYNVMGVAKAALEASVRYLAASLGPRGIRVNAISPGPMQTLAARGISGFTDMYKHAREVSALRRTNDPDEIGALAAFLASHHARGTTGEVHYMDCGYRFLGI
ncbi:MAG: enoyl-ACP reductase [Chloroflexota bacterium]|nr:MAG: enoyl-ACP reductase [Chloroflexota bacterium]